MSCSLPATRVQEKIKSAGIGKKDLKKRTPEELEAAEEATGTKDGAAEPGFQYVCKISDTDRAAALAEAYKKAKQDAAGMARAVGPNWPRCATSAVFSHRQQQSTMATRPSSE